MSKTRTGMPRRVWYGPDKLRAAYLAGLGKSASEIAAAVGGTNAARVRAMLRTHDIPLLRGTGNEDVLVLRWKTQDRRSLNAVADRIDRDPDELAALILRKTLALGDSALRTLIDELDVV